MPNDQRNPSRLARVIDSAVADAMQGVRQWRQTDSPDAPARVADRLKERVSHAGSSARALRVHLDAAGDDYKLAKYREMEARMRDAMAELNNLEDILEGR